MHPDPATKADSRANRNAGFIRQVGEWHWGCRINPAFRWWRQEAPVSFHNDRTVAVRKARERDAGATAPPSGRRTCDTIVVHNHLNPFEHPPDTLRIPFGRPAERLTSAWPPPPNCPIPVIGCWAFDVGCWMFRGNGPYSNLTSQTLAGTVNLLHGKASAAWEPLPLINTQLQLGVWRAERRWNRFSGFSFPRARAHSRGCWPPWSHETVETIGPHGGAPCTRLKLGANLMVRKREVSGLISPNDQLTDGGPPGPPELLNDLGGPPFGRAPGLVRLLSRRKPTTL